VTLARPATATGLASALALVGACISIDTTPRPWQAATEIVGPLSPELGPPPGPVPPPPTSRLRIASWNVETARDPDALAAAIAASPALATADVILVQEIEDHPGEPGSRASRLAAALGMTWFYAPARLEGDGTHGDAILSRFPLVDPEVKQLPHVDQPINEEPRIAVRASVDLGDGRTLAVVGVHLDVRLGPVDRIRQLDPAVSDNPPVVVVGGDLNTTPWVWVQTAIPLLGIQAIVGQDQAEVVDDYFDDLGFATPIAHDADTQAFPLDIRFDTLCPRGVDALAAGVARTAGSDHSPVWIDVALPTP